MFQSTPASCDAGDPTNRHRKLVSGCFNPLPRRATRETVVLVAARVRQLVSIHSRVVRRGRLVMRLAMPRRQRRFQSTPASCDAGDGEIAASSTRSTCFNPLPRRATRETSPLLKAARTVSVSIHSRVVRRGRRCRCVAGLRNRLVSIHSRVVRRGRPPRFAFRACLGVVSIHSRVVRRGRQRYGAG